MARRKTEKEEELLSRSISFRVTQQKYRQLEYLCQKSDCHSIGEIIRRILSGRPIKLFHQDVSLDRPMEELAGIRQELHAIGVNMNQIIRHFNGSNRESKRIYLANQALGQYSKIEAKVSLLLSLITQLAKKW